MQAYHFPIDELPVRICIQSLYNCVQNILYSCQLRDSIKSESRSAKLVSDAGVSYANLNLVVGTVVILVHSLQPSTIIVRMWDQVHIQLALDPLQSAVSINRSGSECSHHLR